MTDEHDLLLPKFAPAWLIEKAWEELRKPSPMMQLIRAAYGDAQRPEARRSASSSEVGEDA